MKPLFIIALVLKPIVARPPYSGSVHYEPDSTAQKPWELAQFDLAPFKLTDMCVDCKRHDVGLLFECSIKFDWEDPNANQSCTCSEDWEWDSRGSAKGGNYYLTCRDENVEFFQFKFVDMFDLSNFSLSLAHMYRDVKYERDHSSSVPAS
ncbi:hypothetical protein Hte_011356 [Hypoxylon texense]